MKIQAITVADSISPQGHRLWSGLLTFPKYLLAEAKTHRIVSQDSNEIEIMLDVSLNAAKELSRNSASSRAIPTNRLLKMVEENPFIPIAWQKEHKGMQGYEYWTDEEFGEETKMKVADALTNLWLKNRDEAYINASLIMKLGGTKQMANRLLEPFLWTTVLVSGTEWENFFELRAPVYEFDIPRIDKKEVFKSRIQAKEKYPVLRNFTELDWLKANKGQAEIHMMALAEAIWDAQNESKPRQLEAGEWHIPFEDKINPQIVSRYLNHPCNPIIRISTAMAARTSYTVVGDEKQVSYETLLGIHDKLVSNVPRHSSPMEHCAQIPSTKEYNEAIKGKEKGWFYNLRGFKSYRFILENPE